MFHVHERCPDAGGIMYVPSHSHVRIVIFTEVPIFKVKLFSLSLQEDFLLLCPAHSSVKFPNEKSRPRRCLPEADPLPETYETIFSVL